MDGLVMLCLVALLGVCFHFGLDLAWIQAFALAFGLRLSAVVWKGL